MDRRTDHDRFFNSIDSTLVVPFSPHTSALATFSLQFKDKPLWSTVGNYDWFLNRDTTLRLGAGMFEDELGARVTAFQQRKHFGTGVSLGAMNGDLEVGGFVSMPLAWGFPLRRESMGERVHGRSRVTDLGAATALRLSLRGGDPSLNTEPQYFFPRDAEWPRAGQGPAGQNATAAALPSQLSQVWVSETGGPVRSSAAIAENAVYVGSDDGYLYALDLETGVLRWKYRTGSPVASSPAVANGRVFVGSDSGSVYAFLAEGDKRLTEDRVGLQLWRFDAGDAVVGSPLVTLSGRTVFGSRNGTVYAIDVVSGQPAWTHNTGGPVVASPVKSPQPLTVLDSSGRERTERDVIFCASEDGQVSALAERDGNLLWSVSTGAPVRSTPVAWDKKVLVVNEEGAALALNGADGREVWRQQLPGSPGGSPAVDGSRAIVPLRVGRLVGLSLTTGEAEWTTEIPGRIESTPIGVQGPLLYVGSANGHLYGIDRGNGGVRWDFATAAPISASPAVAHGQLVCGSEDGSIYAFGAKTPPEGVTQTRVAAAPRLVDNGPGVGTPGTKPPALPDLAPVKRSWTPPPGWIEKPAPTSPKGDKQSSIISVPKPESPNQPPVIAPSRSEIRMRLTSEPSDAAELPIDLTNQRETTVAWGTTEASAEVDGQPVQNRDGRIEVMRSFEDDGTYPVMMVTGKGTRDERVACRLVIVDTSADPSSPRGVAFSPDGDGIGDTIAFRLFAEGPPNAIAARILDIRDSSGNAVRTWSAPGSGEKACIWDGKDLTGQPVRAGVYEVLYTVKDASGNLRHMTQRVLLQRAGERTASR
jgi:outer membrane protein assembly factor BamB